MSLLEINKGDQFILAWDVSGSMAATDTPSGLTRLQSVMEQSKVFVAEADKFDPDGVSIYLFGHALRTHKDQHSADIEKLLSDLKPTESATMTHLVIEAAYAEHKAKKSEQTFLMIFTDGEPSDPAAVKKSIIKITQDVKDEKEFRIGFLTVGKRSPQLQAYLTNLDDTLTSDGAKYDVVDVKELSEVDFMASVAGMLTD